MAHAGDIEHIRYLNAMVLLARQYGVEIDWENSDLDGGGLRFKNTGDIESFASALRRLMEEMLLMF